MGEGSIECIVVNDKAIIQDLFITNKGLYIIDNMTLCFAKMTMLHVEYHIAFLIRWFFCFDIRLNVLHIMTS